MGKQKFEDLIVWQKSYCLLKEVYQELKACRDFGFKDQITRSSLSVPSNIAEGYERGSNREFIRFLQIAKGSCGELRTQLYAAVDIGYINKEKGDQFVKESLEISYMLNALIAKRKTFQSS